MPPGAPTNPHVEAALESASDNSRLRVSGDHLVDGNAQTVTLRGMSTMGMSMVYGDKGNPFTYLPMTNVQYVDRATQVDDDGATWYPNALRMCFERFPCVNPARLYTVKDTPWAMPETLQFAAWASGATYVPGDVVVSGGNRYTVVKRLWRADAGQAWNPRYVVGDRVVSNLNDSMYQLISTSGSGTPDGNWEFDPGYGGTSTDILEDNGPIQNHWSYVGQFGVANSTAPSALTPQTEYTGTYLYGGLVMYRFLSADVTQAAAEADFAAWKAAVMDPTIARAIANDLYVVICEFDFGPAHHPLRNSRLHDFWGRMATSQWANHPQVIFELFNESESIGTFNGGPGSWSLQKPVLQSVVDLIRLTANNLILVPPPFYSAWIGEATSSPLTGANLAYTYHQYRSQWESFSSNRDQMTTALATGLPIVWTEWGDDTEPATAALSWTVNSTQTPLRAFIGKGGTNPAAGWFAWALTYNWSPGLFDSNTLTNPNPFGISTRDWMLAEAAVAGSPSVSSSASRSTSPSASLSPSSSQSISPSASQSPSSSVSSSSSRSQSPSSSTSRSPSPSAPGSGVWANVTPAGILLGGNDTAAGVGNNYGVQGCFADPAQAGVVYAGVTYQGLWKSTDYGATWARVTVTSGSDPMQLGRPAMRVAPDGSYIITTALYPISGLSNGAWKSLNGGQTWTRYAVGAPNADDMGGFEILSSDKNRVIGISHSSPFNMYESRDAGQTWTDQGTLPGGRGGGPDAIWLDANTILAIGDGDNGSGPGTYRGVRSGSTWPWTWTWTHVDVQQHWHGVSQLYNAGGGVIITGGGFGIRKSTDNGVTWSQVSSTYSGSLVPTATTLYSTASYASQAGFGPWLSRAPLPAGTSWSAMSEPSGFNNGWLAAAAMDSGGGQYVVVGGCWNAGIWRLVE